MMSIITGKSLEQKARNLQNKTSIFDLFGAKQERMEESAVMFKQAATKYFTEKEFENAIRCLKDSIKIYNKINSSVYNLEENTKLLITFYKATDNCDQNELIKFHKNLADIYSMSGKMIDFNDQCMEISKIFENDGKFELALKELEYCVDCKCYEKVLEKKADILLKLNKYGDASVVFKECGKKYITKSNITGTIFARPMFFMSMLCIMATKNIENSNKHLDNIICIDNTFANSVEGKCILNMIKALNCGNVNDFEQSCALYELTKRLTDQQVDLLILAKEMLIGKQANLSDTDDGIDLC